MTYKQFVERAIQLVPCRLKNYYVDEYEYLYGSFDISGKNIDDVVLVDAREIGGVSGGHCWEDSDPQPYEANETFSDHLDAILKPFAPDITYLEYKEICREYVVETQTDHEYYGNCTEYEVRKLSLKWLYDYLTPKGFLQHG